MNEESYTDSYVTMFLNNDLLAEDPGALLVLLFLFLGRILPIIGMAPFLGAKVLPHPVKLCFGLTLFAIFLPHLVQVTTTRLAFDMTSLALFVKELFIGFSMGFIISVPFIIVQCAGMFVDHQRGGASLMVNDPTIQNQSSPLGTIFNLVLIYLFFTIDGPFLFFNSLMDSYTYLPPDQFLSNSFFDQSSEFWKLIIGLMQTVTRIGTQLASPALIAILMTDVFLGIANRLAPQVQITFLGMPLKSLLGLAVICIGWKLLTDQMILETYSWLNTVSSLNLTFKPPETLPSP